MAIFVRFWRAKSEEKIFGKNRNIRFFLLGNGLEWCKRCSQTKTFFSKFLNAFDFFSKMSKNAQKSKNCPKSLNFEANSMNDGMLRFGWKIFWELLGPRGEFFKTNCKKWRSLARALGVLFLRRFVRRLVALANFRYFFQVLKILQFFCASDLASLGLRLKNCRILRTWQNYRKLARTSAPHFTQSRWT